MYVLHTASKAPFAIVYSGPRGGMPAPPTIEGYAYTAEAARKRARRLGRYRIVAPIVDGKVTLEVRS